MTIMVSDMTACTVVIAIFQPYTDSNTTDRFDSEHNMCVTLCISAEYC